MRLATIDIETTSIPDLVKNIDKIFCIAVKINNEPTKCFTYLYTSYSDGNLKQALNLINSADLVIGHNIIKFDIPVINRLVGKVTPKLVDTLIDAKLMYSSDELIAIDYGIKDFPSSLIGSYSLKAFGYRFGLNKIEYEDFSKLSPEMVEYCKRDVDLTYKIYKNLSSNENYPSELVRSTEYHFASCIFDQQEYGVYFDYDKAMKYATSLKIKKMNIEHTLLKIFPPILVPDGDIVTPAKARRTKQWIEIKPDAFKNIRPFKSLPIMKNGRYKYPSKSTKWSTVPLRCIYNYIDGAYQKIKLQKFNPGSRAQVVERIIKDYGWEPTNYTEKGSVRLEFD